MLIDLEKIESSIIKVLKPTELDTVIKQRESIQSKRNYFEDKEVKQVFVCHGKNL